MPEWLKSTELNIHVVKKEMATHSSVFLPGKSLGHEEPGGLQSVGVAELDTTEWLSMHISMWSIFSHLSAGLLFKFSEYGHNWNPCMDLVKYEPWLYVCVHQGFFPYTPKTFGSYLYYCTYQIHEFHVYFPAIDWRCMFFQNSHVETCGDTWRWSLRELIKSWGWSPHKWN